MTTESIKTKVRIENWNGVEFPQHYPMNSTPMRRAWWNDKLQLICYVKRQEIFAISPAGNGRSVFDWVKKAQTLVDQKFAISQELQEVLDEECRKQQEWEEKCRQYHAEQDRLNQEKSRLAGAPCAYWDRDYQNGGFGNLRIWFICEDGRKSIFRVDVYSDCFGDHASGWVLEDGKLSSEEESQCRAFLTWRRTQDLSRAASSLWELWVKAGKP